MSHALRPLLLAALLTLGMPALAQDQGGDSEPASERESAGDRVRQVERDGGRVLQAEPMQRSGREVYRLKVLTPEGRVRVLDDSRRRDSRPESIDDRRFERSDRQRGSDRAPAPERAPRRAPAPERTQAPPSDGGSGGGYRRRRD
jgi:hypothetical protein